MIKIFKLFFSIIFVLVLLSSNSNAEIEYDAVTGVFESNVNAEIDYADRSKQFENIENYIKGGQVRNSDLNHYIKILINAKNELSDAKKEVDKNIGFVQKRIEALGDLPEDTEVESIAKKRQQFNQEATHYRTELAEVDILLAKINELDALISNTRNRELLGRLFDKQSPLIYPHNFFNSTKLFIGFMFDVIKSPIDWYKNLTSEQKSDVNSNILPVFLVIVLSFIVGLYLRMLIMKRFGYKNIPQPKYIIKVFAAFFVAVAYGAVPASIVLGFILWLKGTEVLSIGFFGLIVNSFLYYFLYVFLALAVSRVIFAPYNGKWRLVDVSDDRAKKIKSALYLSVTLIGVFSLLENIATRSSYPIELISYLSAISGAIKVFSFLIVSKRMFWDDALSLYAEDESDEVSIYDRGTELAGITSSKSSKVTFALSLLSVGFFAISLFGYARLSSYMINRFLLSFIMVGLFVIIRKATTEVLHRLLLLIFWTRNFKLRRRLIYKIDFWVNLIIDTFFILVVAFGLLSLWGMSKDVLFDWIRKLFFGFNIGGIEISLLSIVLGIIIFVVSITVVRILKKRLMTNILSKMDMDDGIKHSLASGFGFVGFIFAAIIAIVVMGGNLTNLALIAGALSFGIGLGLQNIVNNFVSGIILLFERPVKVGDWVVINNYEGLVKQINIRATEVQIWNGSIVIIPNADFLASSVINYTLRDRQGRIEVPVSVAYGTDVEKVRNILIEIAAKNKRVTKKPEPYVIFMRFGNTSLDFELRCFTGDIMNRLSISSELRFEINRRFNEGGIKLAIPQIIYRSAAEAGFPLCNDVNENI
ncbi:MAG: mechanosensitive ion channel [Lactobacillaceae bacterium]|jgi:small-conductance mechanosensitive channel|nr:mechanosensitive ion channel [Lactobacillaceae bacterium]